MESQLVTVFQFGVFCIL